MVAIIICSDFGAQKIKSDTVSTVSPSISHEVMGQDDYTKAFDCVDYNKMWKILKEMEILDHLTCLLRNLYASQEATVRIGHGTDWFQVGKGYIKAVYRHPAYLTYMQSTS